MNVIQNLENNEKVKNEEILDDLITFQLKKIEKYDEEYLLNEASEEAMKNMIELLKMRKEPKTAKI